MTVFLYRGIGIPVIAAFHPHPDQLRYYAQSALSGFDTLDGEAAVQNARDDLNALLAYLGRFADYAVPILGVSKVEPWIGLKETIGDAETHDFSDLKRAGTCF